MSPAIIEANLECESIAWLATLAFEIFVPTKLFSLFGSYESALKRNLNTLAISRRIKGVQNLH